MYVLSTNNTGRAYGAQYGALYGARPNRPGENCGAPYGARLRGAIRGALARLRGAIRGASVRKPVRKPIRGAPAQSTPWWCVQSLFQPQPHAWRRGGHHGQHGCRLHHLLSKMRAALRCGVAAAAQEPGPRTAAGSRDVLSWCWICVAHAWSVGVHARVYSGQGLTVRQAHATTHRSPLTAAMASTQC